MSTFLSRLYAGQITAIGSLESRFTIIKDTREIHLSEIVKAPDHQTAADLILDWIQSNLRKENLAVVVHRLVHGGPRHLEVEKINHEMIQDLKNFRALDPEHLPDEIFLIETFRKRFIDLPQIACFDTTFHKEMPRVAQIIPIPRNYESFGVRRYGFHGLSYTFLMQELERVAGSKLARGRVVLAHLGSGASLAAVLDGKSQDTSMGFTPAAGVIMGTRCGDIDPGLVGFLGATEDMDAKKFNHLVNFQSGLLGVSETSSDLRALLAVEGEDVRAKEAVSLFCYQVKKYIGAYAAALGGLDVLVFSGGIGENAAIVRRRVCENLEFLGIEIDSQRNENHEAVISSTKSTVTVRVIKTDEEKIMAQMAFKFINLR